MACVLFFLVLGLALLWRVREERAVAVSQPEGQPMITAIVHFTLPADIDARKPPNCSRSSAPKYRDMKGLVRKYYLFDGENRTGGGIYLWKTRADAEAVYTPQWKAYIAERYGAAARDPLFRDPGRGRQRKPEDPGRRGLTVLQTTPLRGRTFRA